jgi:sec-independent protein translocase protein TatA
MGSLSIWHWMIVLAVGLLLFGGRGKVSDLMGDFAKGIKQFKKGLADDEPADAAKSDAAVKTLDHQAAAGETARRAEADSKVERTLS